MTSAPASARRGLPGSLLARGAQRTGWGFVAMIVLSVVASLILIGAVAAGQAAEAWRGRLTGSATVVVRAGGLESADAAAARATEALGAMPPVARAWPLDAAASDPAIARLVDRDSPKGGEPRLIAVTFKTGNAPNAAELARALKADGLDAGVDDHRPSSSPILRAVALTGLVAAAAMAAIVVAVGAIADVATRRRLTAEGRTVDLLRLVGTVDGFVGRLFWARSASAAAWAGVVGAAAAMAVAAAWRLWGSTPRGAPALTWPDLAAGAAWPLIAALIGAVAAHRVVAGRLRNAP